MKKSIILITLLSTGICHAQSDTINSRFSDYNVTIESEKAAFGGPVSVGSGFNYQGELIDAGAPANGNYDFSFQLYNLSSNGNQIGGSVIKGNRLVTNGLINIADIDFGDASYDGDERWLSVTVRETGNANSEMTLTPRQKIHATPYSVQADYLGPLGASDGDILKFTGGSWTPTAAASGTSPWTVVGDDITFADGLVSVGTDGNSSTNGTASNKGMFTIGADASQITFDGDDIQRINGGTPSTLFLNWYGGNITMARTGNITTVRGELTVNEDINAGAKITASDSGDADMKAYVYGRANSTGAKILAQSSDGFTVSRTSLGLYRIELTDTAINTDYMVVATTNSSAPKFTSVVIGSDGFDLHVWDTSGNHTDHSFAFVVYRK